jgi:hypothetical protein
MRTIGLLLLLSLLSNAPARAEFPLAVRTMIGGGMGGGSYDMHGGTAGMSGLAAIDVAWRRSDRHALGLSLEASGYSAGAGTLQWRPGPATLDEGEHVALLLNYERSEIIRGGQPFYQFGAGVGRTRGRFGRDAATYAGLALGAAAGVRIAPPPGPLGFVFGIRTTHVVATDLRSHGLGIVLGLVIQPRIGGHAAGEDASP